VATQRASSEASTSPTSRARSPGGRKIPTSGRDIGCFVGVASDGSRRILRYARYGRVARTHREGQLSSKSGGFSTEGFGRSPEVSRRAPDSVCGQSPPIAQAAGEPTEFASPGSSRADGRWIRNTDPRLFSLSNEIEAPFLSTSCLASARLSRGLRTAGESPCLLGRTCGIAAGSGPCRCRRPCLAPRCASVGAHRDRSSRRRRPRA
jgi:hypothetical protein